MPHVQKEIVPGTPVRVYRNLHQRCWSVQTYVRGKGWRLARHESALFITDVTYHVNERIRQQVIANRHKDIHAFVCGKWLTGGSGNSLDALVGHARTGPRNVTYNPYKAGHFMFDDGPATPLACAWFTNLVIGYTTFDLT
jgi:hypothetical protein